VKRTFLAAVASCLAVLSACGGPAPGDAWLEPIVAVPAPVATGSRFPHLASGGDGGPVVMSWLEPAPDGAFALRYARWQGERWSPPETVSAGRDWFINWADFPSVVPVTATHWTAHWLQQKPDNVYSYDVRIASSNDGGRTWSAARTPHDDDTPTEHGFVSIAPRDGGTYAVWLDGRKTGAGEHGHGADHHGTGGAMTLRGAVIAPDGAREGAEIDARVCDCCQTDAVNTADALLVVYRDRGEDELRDIRAVRLEARGWTSPVAVHADGWRIDACPVNGPAVDARGDDVAVAWFTAPDQPRVRLAFSGDGGRTFASPFEVASGRIVGRVDVVLLDDGRAVVSWLEDVATGAEIRVQPYTAAGAAGPVVTVARTAIARSSGFPQVMRAGNRLLFAWTESTDSPIVRTAAAVLD
jgi:hypothetical protein